MRITFGSADDYLEFVRTNSGKILVVISAKDFQNNLRTVVNSAEVTDQQLTELLKELSLSSPTDKVTL